MFYKLQSKSMPEKPTHALGLCKLDDYHNSCTVPADDDDVQNENDFDE